MNCNIVKYLDKFYGRHMTPKPAVIRWINSTRNDSKDSNDHAQKNKNIASKLLHFMAHVKIKTKSFKEKQFNCF